MMLRLNFGQGRRLTRQAGKNRHVASAAGALLGPAALMAYVLAFWSLAADLGVLESFALSGLFSHWQVWLPLAGVVHVLAHFLNKYGDSGRFEAPEVVSSLPFRKRAS